MLAGASLHLDLGRVAARVEPRIDLLTIGPDARGDALLQAAQRRIRRQRPLEREIAPRRGEALPAVVAKRDDRRVDLVPVGASM